MHSSKSFVLYDHCTLSFNSRPEAALDVFRDIAQDRGIRTRSKYLKKHGPLQTKDELMDEMKSMMRPSRKAKNEKDRAKNETRRKTREGQFCFVVTTPCAVTQSRLPQKHIFLRAHLVCVERIIKAGQGDHLRCVSGFQMTACPVVSA